jgi:hypothetical protein
MEEVKQNKQMLLYGVGLFILVITITDMERPLSSQ